jgi:hypothetical protein
LFILYTKHTDTRCGKYDEVTHDQAHALKIEIKVFGNQVLRIRGVELRRHTMMKNCIMSNTIISFWLVEWFNQVE